jgi:hypothetical protein
MLGLVLFQITKNKNERMGNSKRRVEADFVYSYISKSKTIENVKNRFTKIKADTGMWTNLFPSTVTTVYPRPSAKPASISLKAHADRPSFRYKNPAYNGFLHPRLTLLFVLIF